MRPSCPLSNLPRLKLGWFDMVGVVGVGVGMNWRNWEVWALVLITRIGVVGDLR